MLDDVLGFKLLLVDNGLKLVVLFVDFFKDLFLKALLAHHSILHLRA
jgi:hypothetical protein